MRLATVFWGACKLPDGRFLWVVLDPDPNFDKWIGTGFEPTRDAAHDAALVVIRENVDRFEIEDRRNDRFWLDRSVRLDDSTWIPSPRAGYATRYRELQARARRCRKTTRETGAQPLEYVYAYWPAFDDQEGGWTTRQVIRKTARKVFVGGQCWPVAEETIALDRAALERDGSVWHRPSRQRFHLRPGSDEEAGPISRPPQHLLAALERLALSWPCDREALAAAFRKRSKETHPDTGGSAEEFRKVKEAYDVLAKLLPASAG